jgi:hypothetical protein
MGWHWGRVPAACVVLAVCLAAAALGSATSPAAAHGDGLLVRGSLTLAPGEVAAYHGSVHYHRLVARVVADWRRLRRARREGQAT